MKKGQLIALVDPIDLQMAYDEAKANLGAATSKVRTDEGYQWQMTHLQN